jgi:hypothetical protein
MSFATLYYTVTAASGGNSNWIWLTSACTGLCHYGYVRVAPTAADYHQELTGRCHFMDPEPMDVGHALQGQFLDMSIGGLQVSTFGSFKLAPVWMILLWH